MSASFDIELWLQVVDLNPDSVEKIKKAKIIDLDSLCLLSPYDVTALKLDIGDRGKFRKALKKLRLQCPDDDDASSTSDVDDSFDGTDPDHVSLQHHLQAENLIKLQADQECLSKEQFDLLKKLSQPNLQQSQPSLPLLSGQPSLLSAQQPASQPLFDGQPSLFGQPLCQTQQQQVPQQVTSSLDQLAGLLASLNLSLVPTNPVPVEQFHQKTVVPSIQQQSAVVSDLARQLIPPQTLLGSVLQQPPPAYPVSASQQPPAVQQGLPFAVQNSAFPVQNTAFPVQNTAFPVQNSSYPVAASSRPLLRDSAASVTGYPFVQVPFPSDTIPFTTLSTQLDSATTTSLAAHPALQHINNLSVDGTVKDILGIEDCGRAAQACKKGEKPLLPVDYVTIIPGCQPEADEVLNEHNGIELVLRSAGPKKPTADRLTTGQYIEASNIILQLLLPTFSLQDLADYIEFQRMIGYFMQVFNVGSVFLLDHEHRKNVFSKKHKWNRIDNALSTGILKRKVDAPTSYSKPAKKRTQSAPKSVSQHSSTPCVNYNDKSKYCPFNPCKDPHKCSTEGCGQSHPAYKHVDSTSRFRKNTDSVGGNF
jgi:hypothetical protein